MGRRKLYKTEEEKKAQRAAYQRTWRLENPEKFKRSRITGERDRHVRYYKSHRQQVNAYKTRHREMNKEQYNLLARERYDPLKDRAGAVKRRYGITLEQIEQMRIEQNNQCKTCKQEFTKTPHVDHCHETGVVRGLLCGHCNRMLGLINESVDTLKNMIEYIEINRPILGSTIHTISTET